MGVVAVVAAAVAAAVAEAVATFASQRGSAQERTSARSYSKMPADQQLVGRNAVNLPAPRHRWLPPGLPFPSEHRCAMMDAGAQSGQENKQSQGPPRAPAVPLPPTGSKLRRRPSGSTLHS